MSGCAKQDSSEWRTFKALTTTPQAWFLIGLSARPADALVVWEAIASARALHIWYSCSLRSFMHSWSKIHEPCYAESWNVFCLEGISTKGLKPVSPLTGATLIGATITGATLTGATLTGTTLTGTSVHTNWSHTKRQKIPLKEIWVRRGLPAFMTNP